MQKGTNDAKMMQNLQVVHVRGNVGYVLILGLIINYVK